MPSLISDLRLACRTLAKSPAFTAAAVLTVAFGLGGNIAMLSVANALFLRPLPLIEEPARLAWVLGANKETGRTHAASYPDARDLAGLRDVFSGVLAATRVEVNFAAAGAPTRLPGMVVSANYFRVLGVRPAFGRGFLPEEEQTPGAHPVAVISDSLWRREFGADPAAVGRAITVNGKPFAVVGVLPAGFVGAEFGERPPDVYVPVTMITQAAPQFSNALEEHALWVFSIIGRLRPGVSPQRAAAAVDALMSNRPGPPGDVIKTFRVLPMSGAMHPNDRSEGLAVGALGFGIAGIVLLIACANIAALLLGRAAGRRRELAVRLALGASRWRIVRQLLSESVVVSFAAAGVGLLAAAWTTNALLSALNVPLPIDASPDTRVAAGAVGLAIVAALLFGTAPAFAATQTEIAASLSDGAATAGIPPARRRLQRVFVACQIALALMLLSCGAMLLRSIQAVTRADVGFEMSDHVLTASIDLAAQGYQPGRARAVTDVLLERVRTLPGVRSATIAGLVPLGGVMWGTHARVEASDSPAGRSVGLVFVNPVRPGFFRTTGMRLLAGRDFTTADDHGADAVAIVSQAMAGESWPGHAPIGRRFKLGDDGAPWMTVVGVAADAADGPGEAPQPFVYLPLLQHDWRSAQALLVRTDGPAAALAPALAAEIRRVDPSLPAFNVSTLQDVARERLQPRKAGSTVVAAFGLLALGLAALGLYGVVSLSVQQRQRELAIRMALGAEAGRIVRMVLSEGARLALVGLAVGAVLAVAATRLLASMFITVGSFDLPTWVVSAGVVSATVVLASLLPAVRASRLDPVSTIRTE